MKKVFIPVILLFLLFAFPFPSLGDEEESQEFSEESTVAIVNGEEITREELDWRLENIYGRDTLDRMIEERLVKQEGVKQGVKVESSELEVKEKVDELIARFSSQDEFEKLLAQSNMTLRDVREQVTVKLILERLVAKKISEEELRDYFNQNKESFAQPDWPATFKNSRERVKEMLIAQRTQGKLEELKDKAKIENFLGKKEKKKRPKEVVKEEIVKEPSEVLKEVSLAMFSGNAETVAIVNGEEITRGELDWRLENIYGRDTLDRMIEERLVKQEGVKQGVKVESSELEVKEKVDELIARFSSQDEFEKLLAQSNMTLRDVREQVTVKLILERLVAKKISEEELRDYFNQNKESFAQPDWPATFKNSRERVKEMLISQKTQGYLEELKDNAKIEDFLGIY